MRLCRFLTCLGLTVVKIAPGKVVGYSNGDISSSVFGIVKKQTGIPWNGKFFLQKKSATLHFHNIMSCKGYMSQNCHENYGKSKLMQKCIKYMYKLSKKNACFCTYTRHVMQSMYFRLTKVPGFIM